MPDFIRQHSDTWLRYFAERGHPDVQPLAAGTEGALYRLGDGTVAKVWANRSAAELCLAQRFYADIARTTLPFATPEIISVAEVDGVSVTIERELPGRPLSEFLSFEGTSAPEAAVECIVSVLAGLRLVPGTADMRALAVLDESTPMWYAQPTFSSALADLLRRRVERFGPVLCERVPEFDRTYADVLAGLAALDPVPDTVVHGDLIPGNILVDDELQPLAVLDFGFLTTAGDPRFDASMAAAIFNMYGPHAREITTQMTARICAETGYDLGVMRLYLAAYALATSNCFTDDGSDGHFEWCAEILAGWRMHP